MARDEARAVEGHLVEQRFLWQYDVELLGEFDHGVEVACLDIDVCQWQSESRDAADDAWQRKCADDVPYGVAPAGEAEFFRMRRARYVDLELARFVGLVDDLLQAL